MDYGPLFFYDIDTPITMAQLRAQGRCEYLEASLIPFYAAYLSFTGGPALRELEQRFGSPRAIPLYCSVDSDIYKPVPTRAKYACDLSYLGTYAPDRQPKLMSLLNTPARHMPEYTFLIAGAMYPADSSFETNVQRMTHVSPADHPAFYSSSRFTLNLTRSEMVAAGWSPSVRLFEASACGAAILSDSWSGLDNFLSPGEEILLPKDAAEVISIVRDMSDRERVRISSRARQRILAEHTSDHRAAEFEAIVSASSMRASSSVQTVPQTSSAASPVSFH
jgi:spore maturation protein CgeB